MVIAEEIIKVREVRRSDPLSTWGAVLTMGYLHDGHLSLIRRARAENDKLSVSIFVNPTQFGSELDLQTYPLDLERDLSLLEQEKVDLVFMPSRAVMYPGGFQTAVEITEVTRTLEGLARPGHFKGVATVVTKLFNILEPDRSYFGQKDAQQVAVIKRLVQDLNLDIEIVVCPIVRESDGLAMSSRNSRLSPDQRSAAPVLYQALSAGEEMVRSGNRDAERVRQQLRRIIEAEPLAKIDYISVADPVTLQELEQIVANTLLSLAVYFGEVRLIDNILVDGLM